MTQIQIPAVTLADGVTIPQLGFGVFQIPPDDTAATVTKAFELGYRHIDTAAIYRNEAGVGEALAATDLARDELFITTKLWNAEQGYDTTLRAFDASMEKLGLDVLDLYLIHWPLPSRDKYVDTWKALVQLKEDGRIRSIGVSNFQPAHLRRLLDEVGVVPSVNQVELHPFLQQGPLRAVHAEHGIATEAWSPLAQGKVLDAPVLTRIAAEHDKTAAQVVLRWHVDLGNVVIPKSVTPSRMAENLDIFDFSLSDAELAAVAGIDRAERIGFDPDTMDIG